jgi:8-oxo-dGTP diphosphatase
VAPGFLGDPVETEEAIPLWFELQKLPLDEMWEDDRLWLPRMLDGESFSGFFEFDGEKMMSESVVWGTDGWSC